MKIGARLRSCTFLFFLLAAGCSESLFFYSPVSPVRLALQEVPEGVQEVGFRSGDGTGLRGWFVRARGTPLGTVIHFHGNNKDIAGHFRYVDWLPAGGYNVFLFDYRGFGASEGTANRRGLHEDCIAAIEHVRSRPDVDARRLLVFGQSLGGTCALTAVAAGAKTGIRAIVSEGTFSSHRAIAREKIEGYPLPEFAKSALVQLFVGRDLDAEDAVSSIGGIPLLLIHGTQDDVVPYHHVERLRAAAPGQATLWAIPEGRHLDTFVQRAVPYRQKLLDFFAKTLDGAEESASSAEAPDQ